jgi:hypothetical protein
MRNQAIVVLGISNPTKSGLGRVPHISKHDKKCSKTVPSFFPQFLSFQKSHHFS